MEMKSSNPNALKDLSTHIEDLKGVTGKVGWFENSRYENGTPVAYVAAIQELGHGPIPPRLGMRTTAAEKRPEWVAKAAEGARAVLKGDMTARQAMELLAMKAEGDVSKHIATVTQPPLSPITLLARARKKRGEAITGKTIGEIAKQVKNSSPADIAAATAGVSNKPLIDTRLLFDTLTSVVESA